MGKIRIKTLGTEEEQAQKEKGKRRREEKKKRLTHIAGLKGGERIVDMSATAPETAGEAAKERSRIVTAEARSWIEGIGGRARVTRPPRQRGQTYLSAKKLIEPGKLYPISQALELVKKTSLSRFDGSVEVHINLDEKGKQGLRGQVSLPHGTGRTTRVAVADDKLIEQLEHGKIDFDILVASPSMMPKLVKYGKLLGPRGLLPNPKSGTITNDPEGLALSLSKGQTQYKSETGAPIIHLVIGKTSFPAKHLEENFQALISAIGLQKIKSIFLKSTMSPAIKLEVNSSG